MQITVRIAILLAVAAGATAAQTYHAAEYISGGGWSAVAPIPPTYQRGIILMRGNGSVAALAYPNQVARAFTMDVDNKHVVALITPDYKNLTMPGTAGIYRFDPFSMTYTTIYGPDTLRCARPWHLWIDQDGDYVFNTSWPTPTGWEYAVMKVTAGGRLSTVLSSVNVGRNTWLSGYIGCNYDNGKLMVVDNIRVSTSILAPVLEFDSSGAVTTFNDGLNGWSLCGNYHLEQNVRNGHIEGPHDEVLYRLSRGTSSKTAIGALKINPSVARRVDTARFDLQTAPRQRMVSLPWNPWQGGFQQWLLYIAPDGTVTSMQYQNTQVSLPVLSNYDLAFYRGRHIQTVKTGAHRWAILLSCPRSPGMPYALAAGLSGVRPGVALPDGRRINLAVDPLTHATLHNCIPMVFNPGASTLNATGEGRGWIDLSALNPPPGGFGVPLWIAMAVLDPKAPSGIKYLPDTYVMRI